MRKVMVLAVGLLTAGLLQAAELDIAHCEFPQPPTVPDGDAASEAEMGEAGAAVREFVSAVQTSLECLKAAEVSLGEEITDEQQARIVAVYNEGVDQMNAVAERYNEQVRLYKEQ